MLDVYYQDATILLSPLNFIQLITGGRESWIWEPLEMIPV